MKDWIEMNSDNSITGFVRCYLQPLSISKNLRSVDVRNVKKVERGMVFIGTPISHTRIKLTAFI